MENEFINQKDNEPSVSQNTNETISATDELHTATTQSDNSTDIEKESFTPYAYKRLQRARKKALHYGVEIPKLQYKLDMPAKPRKLFIVSGYILLGIMIAFIVGLIALGIASGFGTFLGKFFTEGPEMYEGNELMDGFGFTALINAGLALAYFVLFLILLIPIVIIIFLRSAISHTFILARASYQEIGRGHAFLNYIIYTLAAAVILIASFVVLITQTATKMHWAVILIWWVVIAILIFYGVAMIIERVRARREFNKLPEEIKQDFIAQDEAWQKYKRRKDNSNNSTTWRW